MLFAGLFLALGFYLMPSLNKMSSGGVSQRPNGTIYAWVDSFLLPDGLLDKEVPHTGNLPAAVAQARAYRQKTGKPKRIFVDFTGVTCTNCNLNERNVFPRPNIFALFNKYVVVKLYTDTIPNKYYDEAVQATLDSQRQKADASVNLEFQRQIFDDEKLPLYVILEPQLDDTIKIVGIYPEGRINNEVAFAEFLRNPK